MRNGEEHLVVVTCGHEIVRNPGHKVSSMFAQDLESTILSDPLKQVLYNVSLCITFVFFMSWTRSIMNIYG